MSLGVLTKNHVPTLASQSGLFAWVQAAAFEQNISFFQTKMFIFQFFIVATSHYKLQQMNKLWP